MKTSTLTYDRLGAAAVGILLGASVVPLLTPTPLAIGVSLIGSTVLLVGWLLPLDRRVLLAGVAALLTAAWGWRGILSTPDLLRSPIELTGVVASLPELGDRSTRVRLRITAASEQPLVGRVVELSVPPDQAVAPAHHLTCTCEPIVIDTGRRNRLLAQGVSARFAAKQVTLGALDQRPRWWLLRLREALVAAADRTWPLPESSLAAGLTVGSREAFAPALADAMQRTGTTHLVAVSGSNVAIVLWIAASVLPVRRPRVRFGVLSAILAVFMILTGASASVVRAGLMAWVLAVASLLGRPVSSLRLLLVVAAAMGLIHPLIVTSDLGFQLSFLAVLSLITLVPIAELFVPGPPWLRTSVATTLAAYIATSPLIASTFGTVSLVAPLANLAVAALVTPTMVLALGVVLAAAAFPAVSGLLGWLTWPVLATISWVIERAAAVPLASIQLRISPWWSLAMLGLLVAVGMWPRTPLRPAVAP